MNNSILFSNQEDLWGALLSEDNEIINNLLNILDSLEIKFVSDHLKKMTSEDGWHLSQQRSAAFALDIIDKKYLQK
ncbi:MAG: hypothetical protein Q7J07_03825 [Pelolinea sp.]|nr:hypothetical protein [Pelolinea sp.]